MTKVLIPYALSDLNLGDDNNNLDLKGKQILKNRRAVLNELRCLSGIPEIVRSLRQNSMYTLVSNPEGGKLFKDSAGNIKGVFYKDGKIVEHARFKAVSPSLVKAATTAGSQILLVSIAMQLNRIEKEISRIINEFHNDRISEIFSGVSQFRQAMKMHDSGRQSRMVEHAIQTLNSGIEKTSRALKVQIDDAPNPETGFWDNWIIDKSKTASHKIGLADESFKACLLGIETLSQCFIVINEPEAAAASIMSSLSLLKTSGIETAAKKARLIPVTDNSLPESPWLAFLEREPYLRDSIHQCRLIAGYEHESIEIELQPAELMEVLNE